MKGMLITMAKKSNIITFSSRGFGRTQSEILASLGKKFEEISKLRPDLVCFPEEILISGGDSSNPNWERNNSLALELCRTQAKKLRANVEVCLEEPSEAYPGKRYNTSYLIDRDGSILAKYRKRHITFRAISHDGLPGESIVVADTDIGRIGLSTCFDIGWRGDWQALEDAGARIVVWNSAYHGGKLLNAYAAVHMYYIVTSVWNAPSRIIDPFGNDIAESSGWDAFASEEVDARAEIFHFDHHEDMLPKLRAEYGDRVSFRVEPLGNMFELSVDDPLTLEEVKERFGLVNYRDYHKQSTIDNAKLLAEYPEE